MSYDDISKAGDKNEKKQQKINWNVIKLKGDTSLEFAQQLRKQNEFLSTFWARNGFT